jgi:outer membrane lipoprotein-sorting protein
MQRELVAVVKALAFNFLISLVLLSCQTFPKPKDYSDSPQKLHSILQGQDHIKSLTGEIAVELWENHQKLFFRQFFATKAKNYLRIDTISPFEQPIMTLVSNDQEIKLYELEKKTVYVGKQSPANFRQLLRFPISAEELSAVIRGQVPRIKDEGGMVSWDADHNAYVLELQKDELKQIIKIHALSRQVIYISHFEGQKKILEIELLDYDEKQNIPKNIYLKLPTQDIIMVIKLKEFECNVEFPDETFQLELPKRVNIENID